jgi:hypothetical protein
MILVNHFAFIDLVYAQVQHYDLFCCILISFYLIVMGSRIHVQMLEPFFTVSAERLSRTLETLGFAVWRCCALFLSHTHTHTLSLSPYI